MNVWIGLSTLVKRSGIFRIVLCTRLDIWAFGSGECTGNPGAELSCSSEQWGIYQLLLDSHQNLCGFESYNLVLSVYWLMSTDFCYPSSAHTQTHTHTTITTTTTTTVYVTKRKEFLKNHMSSPWGRIQ